jgi:transposase
LPGGIKRIARELGIARDTVRKVLRSGAAELSYKREVQPQRKLGLWVETLTAILESEEKLPRRERRSTIRLFEELRGRGYDGAHDSVHRFVKAARRSRANASAGLHSAAVRSRRGLSVRLEP